MRARSLGLGLALVGAAALWAFSRTRRGQVAQVAALDQLEEIEVTARRLPEVVTGAASSVVDTAGGWLEGVIVTAQRIAETVSNVLLPRGIRNNNPGNLRPGSSWQGIVGQDGGYLVFDKPENGIRALGKNLLTYFRVHQLDTVRGIISRWAPPQGRDPVTGKAYSQDTESYIADVARALGVAPDARIDVPARLDQLVPAIIKHENGQQPYSAAVIGEGIRRALA